MRMLRFLIISLTLLGILSQTWAQSDVGEIVAALKEKTPKCVVLLLDVSESMKVDDYNRKMHSAAETILKESLQDGDQAVLYTFGAGFKKVFDDVPQTPAARRKLIEQLPLKPEAGEGTNIRQPQHEALKLARASGRTPFVVILTDSFNDPPKNTPTAYTEYKKYYTPGKLDVYPATSENRDYESLLSWMSESGGKTFGMGVEILPSGRPKERFKVAPKQEAAATPEPSTTSSTPPPPPTKPDELPLALIVGLLGVGALGGLFAVLRPRPMPLRVVGVGAPRDFDVRGNTTLRLGGEGGSAALDAYPLAGTKAVAATIRGARGQFTIQLQPGTSLRVYHNGMPLEKPSPLRYGDEVRVSVVDNTGAVIKESRLKFSDPTKLV